MEYWNDGFKGKDHSNALVEDYRNKNNNIFIKLWNFRDV